MRTIGERLGRAPSTILRELRRNATAVGGYQPFDAHRQATARRARHHRRRVDINHHLGGVVSGLLVSVGARNRSAAICDSNS
ncbi:helix-turn-helix domain-containing protein [Mycobacterium paragordonae]|uniref:helix-turn-helix domain-containing protein n=1 Tax=Mycobacterium paragordonae TaxID=1389713 RepID=UPI003B8A650F